MASHVDWYFTAPLEPLARRRGDALGFRAAADFFADRLAPGLNNGTSDARWISLLCWCLKWSDKAWRAAGEQGLSTRAERAARYAWLRPLELMWIARTLEPRREGTRQLRGRLSVERWLKKKRGREPRFSMSTSQFERYRQTGTYGAYRVALMQLPGLTTGDGWTLGPQGNALAEWVNEALPQDARPDGTPFNGRSKWAFWRGGNEENFWLGLGWKGFTEAGSGRRRVPLLPSPVDDNEALPATERNLLRQVVFSAGSPRLATALSLARARGATSHAALCEALAASRAASDPTVAAVLALLPPFTRFADAAMEAMRRINARIDTEQLQAAPAFAAVADDAGIQDVLRQARRHGEAWLAAPGRATFPHDEVVTALADALQRAQAPADLLRALLAHHASFGGGRRWFLEQGDRLQRLVAQSDVRAADYRFRLSALVRLAAQCGIEGADDALIEAVATSTFGAHEEEVE